ncbi:FAD-dependent oxidoreductase [Thaumasiovibrio subtropicus]|uniref:oxidoreductase n=1 Tax=Thaumasiovibrio subtropicus TaxID=1891207 RepID=UPI000B34B002|nr:FAD-dependent oxidoreductase [Thaumasiovibrio subtropicus]
MNANTEHSVLFEPMHIGKLKLKNRYSMAPMGALGSCDVHGAFTDRGIEYYVERARGGVGLIFTSIQMIENDVETLPMPSLPCPTINPTAYIRSSMELTERVHAYGTKIFAQIGAGWGRSLIPEFASADKAVAASDCSNRFDPSLKHRALTTEEVQYFIQKFVQSAAIAKKAGYDGVEVHAVHEGYLLDQFALEFFNQRTDQYGGSFENRYRFAVEIVKGIKAVCGKDFPVSLRYSLKSQLKGYGQGILPEEDAEERGRDIDEGVRAAKLFEEAGYDALNVDAGTYDSWYWNHPPNYFEPGMYRPFGKIVAEAVNIPVILAGRLDDPDMAARAVKEGAAHGISLGRPLLADPQIVNKIRCGRFDEVRPCLSCHVGCLGRMANVGNLSCAVNPSCMREADYRLKPTHKAKKVVVIGGGVAGMEVARTATERGHNVVLFEKTAQLGGNVIPGSQPPFKHDDATLIRWYEGEMDRYNIDLRMETAASVELIEAEQPDTVVFATGSRPTIPAWLQGVDKPYVLVAEDVLMKPELITGETAVVVGGGLVGAETALWLAQRGKQITLVEAASDIIGGPHGSCFANYQMLKELLIAEKVEVLTDSPLRQVTDKGVHIEHNGDVRNVDAEHVIIALGYKAENSFYNEVANSINADEVFNIGDSQEARTIMTAIWEGFEVARHL